jgi:hypothetical protein
MGQFSAEKPVPPGSTLSGNQQNQLIPTFRPSDFRANLARNSLPARNCAKLFLRRRQRSNRFPSLLGFQELFELAGLNGKSPYARPADGASSAGRKLQRPHFCGWRRRPRDPTVLLGNSQMPLDKYAALISAALAQSTQ